MCSELVPPSTAASASIAVRTTLLSGCCAVSDDPGGLGVEAQPLRARGTRAVDVAQPARPDPAGGAELGDLLEEVDVRVEEERQARGERVHVQPAGQAELHVAEPVSQREREFLARPSSRPP